MRRKAPVSDKEELIRSVATDMLVKWGFIEGSTSNGLLYLRNQSDLRNGIFLAFRQHKDRISLNTYCLVRNDVLQKIFRAISDDKHGFSKKWTISVDLWEIKRIHFNIPDIKGEFDTEGHYAFDPQMVKEHIEKYGTRIVDIYMEDSISECKETISALLSDIEECALPFFDRYSSIEGILELCKREDALPNYCFESPMQHICGLIAALELGDVESAIVIDKNGTSIYETAAKHGNIDLLNSYCELQAKVYSAYNIPYQR